MEIYKDLEFMLQFNTLFMSIFFFILGCCLASFFNVVILRYPKMIEQGNARDVKAWFEEKNIPFPEQLLPLLEKFDLNYPSSHCYSCKTPLKWYHNIPILSYLFLRGKCGFCNAHISIQYPIVEFLGGLTLYLAYFLFSPMGLSVFLLGAFLFIVCFILAAIDFKTFMLPDGLNYVLLWVGLIAATFGVTLYNLSLEQALYGAVVGYFALWIIAKVGKLIKGQDVMGDGDFKLLAALGVYIGWQGAIFTVFFSPFVGIITWLVLKIIGRKDTMVPYGPSIIVGAIFYLFYGKQFLNFLGIAI